MREVSALIVDCFGPGSRDLTGRSPWVDNPRCEDRPDFSLGLSWPRVVHHVYLWYMQLVPDPAAERWLLMMTGASEELEWDRGNLTKHRKHDVALGDVEALIARDFYFAGRIVEPVHAEPRWLALGENARGRRLALVFTRRGNRLRPISCRPMRRKERALYEKARRQEG